MNVQIDSSQDIEHISYKYITIFHKLNDHYALAKNFMNYQNSNWVAQLLKINKMTYVNDVIYQKRDMVLK